MRQFYVGAIAVGLLIATAPGINAQIIRPSVGGTAADDGVQVTATGRVQSVSGLEQFVLETRRMTFRVSYRSRIGQQAIRSGERVRVTGELVEQDRIIADSLQVVGGGTGRPGGRLSRVTTGTIRDIDRTGRRMSVTTSAGVMRVTWDDETEFTRETTRSSPREFRVGDEVRIVGSRTGNDLTARRVLYGGRPGFNNGGVGEIVSLDARAQEMEVDFDGEVVTVRMRNATIRRGNRPAEIDDLRLGQDVRVTGTARGRDTIDASQVEVVRMGEGGRVGNDSDVQTFSGRIVNVAEGLKTFRVQVTGGREVRFTTDEDTSFLRGTSRSSFRALQDGQQVRVRARRDGADWVAQRVEIQ